MSRPIVKLFLWAALLGFASSSTVYAQACAVGYIWDEIPRNGGNAVNVFSYTVMGAGSEGDCSWMWAPGVDTKIRINGEQIGSSGLVVGQPGGAAYFAPEALILENWGSGAYSEETIFSMFCQYFYYCTDYVTSNALSITIDRPSISGLSGVWWLGGGADPDYGLYNQILLTASTNCPGCSETPVWTITQNLEKISLDCETCSVNTVTALVPSNSIGDILLQVSLDGFKSQLFQVTVNAPERFVPASPSSFHVTALGSGHGYFSEIYYEVLPRFGGARFNNISINENFGFWLSQVYGENWPEATAGGTTLTQGILTDKISASCPTASPCAYPDPVFDFTLSKVQSANQTWRAGSTVPGQGVVVQTNVIMYYIGHGDHTTTH